MAISRSIVEAVRSLDPPGRFLEKHPTSGLWSDIGHKKAVEKTSQALRDGAASLRKQLSADLGDPAFLNAVFDEDNKEAKEKGKNEEKEAKGASTDKGDDDNKSQDKEKESTKIANKTKPLKVRLEVGFPLFIHVYCGTLSICTFHLPVQISSEKGTSKSQVQSLRCGSERCEVYSKAEKNGITDLTKASSDDDLFCDFAEAASDVSKNSADPPKPAIFSTLFSHGMDRSVSKGSVSLRLPVIVTLLALRRTTRRFSLGISPERLVRIPPTTPPVPERSTFGVSS
jgi:hypothetical protein